jgi:hypothetical protein
MTGISFFMEMYRCHTDETTPRGGRRIHGRASRESLALGAKSAWDSKSEEHCSVPNSFCYRPVGCLSCDRNRFTARAVDLLFTIQYSTAERGRHR